MDCMLPGLLATLNYTNYYRNKLLLEIFKIQLLKETIRVSNNPLNKNWYRTLNTVLHCGLRAS